MKEMPVVAILGATHRWVIHGGIDRYPLPQNVEAIGFMEFLGILKSFDL